MKRFLSMLLVVVMTFGVTCTAFSEEPEAIPGGAGFIEEPAEPAEAPAEPTQEPAEPTEAPAEPTEEPAEPTEAPAEPTEGPAEPTEAPTEPAEEPTEAPAEQQPPIAFAEEYLEVEAFVGDVLTVPYILSPEVSAEELSVFWESADQTIAVIDASEEDEEKKGLIGEITALAAGKVEISATLPDGASASFTLTVKDAPAVDTPEDEAQDMLVLVIPLGGFSVLADSLPEALQGTADSLRWVSSNPDSVFVSKQGFAYAVMKGSATVSAYPKDQEENDNPVFSLMVDVGPALLHATSGWDGNINWNFNSANATLTLTGTGSMKNYTSVSAAPWAEHKSAIATIVMYNGITTIGNMAFQGFTALNSVSIPDSVYAIGNQAFENCTVLPAIAIPAAVSRIEQGTFSGCFTLSAVTFKGASAMNTIGTKAFYRCTALQTIVLPDSVTKIDSEAFGYCTGLTNVNIPANVTKIEDRTFIGCSSLPTILIPQNVLTIGNGVFEGCVSLSNITFFQGMSGVTSLGNDVFNGCTSLQAITLPTTVTNIGTGLFRDCTKLIGVSAPGLTRIEDDMFNGCAALTILPLYGQVTHIGSRAFQSCIALKTIAIPPQVTTFGTNIFEFCTALTSVTIPNSMTSIPDYMFSNCSSLGTISLPNTILTLGEGAFRKSGLYSIALQSGLGSIGAGAFEECPNLQGIDIPDSVTFIGDRAFANCQSLKSARLPNGVTTLSSYAFSGCQALTHVSLPGSLQVIGSNAFSLCKNLTQVDFPSTVHTIKESAFQGCGALTQVYPGSSLVTLEPNAFRDCVSLSRIDLPDTLTSIQAGAFFNCRALIDIVIPQNVGYIGDQAFYGIAVRNFAFMGNAPSFGSSIVSSVGTFKCLTGKAGFTTPTWYGGFPCVRINDPTGFATRLYTIVLGRAPDPQGVVFWRNALLFNQNTALQVAHGFLMGPEFIARGVSDADYVEILYRACMDRAPDAGGQVFWEQDRLGVGVSRLLAFKEFARSAEFKNICAGYGIAVGTLTITEPADENIEVTLYFCRLYSILLGRSAKYDRDGLNFWTRAVLHNNVTGQAASHGFVNSTEFLNAGHSDTEFIRRLYSALLDRETVTQDEINYYLAEIAANGRLRLFYNFTNSPEFQNKMKSYGIK